MGIDIFFILMSMAGIILNFLNGTLFSVFVWAAILAYATLNLFEHKLKGSKYDY